MRPRRFLPDFSLLHVGAEGGGAVLTVELVRDDGQTVQSNRFEQSLDGLS